MGKPKGVQLTHYNLTSNVLQIQPSEQFNLTWDGSKTLGDIPLSPYSSGGDKILACLPFFHIYGVTRRREGKDAGTERRTSGIDGGWEMKDGSVVEEATRREVKV